MKTAAGELSQQPEESHQPLATSHQRNPQLPARPDWMPPIGYWLLALAFSFLPRDVWRLETRLIALLMTLMLSVTTLWGQQRGGRRGARPAANQLAVKIDPRAKTMKPYFATYRQTFTIVFKDAASARAAKVKALGLYDGKEWAISCRWDDNSPSDIRMRDLMDKYGFKGTFYMNSRQQGYWGKSYGLVKNNKDVDRMLVASGRHTIGGHGARHPSLGVLSRNRIFEEAMRVRADRESTSDTPICSYSFSNMHWSNALEGVQISLDIAEALFRAGYYHNANARFLAQTGLQFPACWLLPWDGARMERWVAALKRFQGNESIRRDNPHLSFSMHAPAYGTEQKWNRLEEKFKNYCGRKEWWYCNHSEYAAYRLQFAHTKVETTVEGNRLLVKLLNVFGTVYRNLRDQSLLMPRGLDVKLSLIHI